MAAAQQEGEKKGIEELEEEEKGGGGGITAKAARLPRWTRQEILVLIQGKRMAENRVRRGRSAALAYGTTAVEPKWATVSSYCKRHGVNRGPVQCRKRWSNLAGDFKKIKEWESRLDLDHDHDHDHESFWLMRNDVRRERKLPGFFDKEVYDILDGVVVAPPPPSPLPSPPPPPPPPAPDEDLLLNKQQKEEDDDDDDDDDGDDYNDDHDEEEKKAAVVFDSGRSAAAEDGLFSDFEQQSEDTAAAALSNNIDNQLPSPTIPAPTPISEKQYEPITAATAAAAGHGDHAIDVAVDGSEKQPAVNPDIGSTSHEREGRKRRRFLPEADDTAAADEVQPGYGTPLALQNQLVDVLERNGRILTAQLEAQNINLKLDREERKDHATSLVSVLNKLADALGKIADKL